jgi:hypothetical protein
MFFSRWSAVVMVSCGFKINQRLDAISLSEAVCQTFPVLVNAPYQIVRHANIKCATRLAREDVKPNSSLA